MLTWRIIDDHFAVFYNSIYRFIRGVVLVEQYLQLASNRHCVEKMRASLKLK